MAIPHQKLQSVWLLSGSCCWIGGRCCLFARVRSWVLPCNWWSGSSWIPKVSLSAFQRRLETSFGHDHEAFWRTSNSNMKDSSGFVSGCFQNPFFDCRSCYPWDTPTGTSSLPFSKSAWVSTGKGFRWRIECRSAFYGSSGLPTHSVFSSSRPGCPDQRLWSWALDSSNCIVLSYGLGN